MKSQRNNPKDLDSVCLDCQDFLDEIKGGCSNCPIGRLKDRFIILKEKSNGNSD
jgi:hypothetical protein